MSAFGIATRLILLLLCAPGVAEAAGFNVVLTINYESAEKTIGLYEGLSGRPNEIARLPGSRIALATTALLAQRRLEINQLEEALEAAKFKQSLAEDVFNMNTARSGVGLLKELFDAVKSRNFSQKVVSTVEQLFPEGTSLTTAIPLFFVAFGHQNIDAFVRRVEWRGETPVFVGEGEGELTIVVNLAKAVGYGRTNDERFVRLLSTVAHEVFHAAFGVYKDNSVAWQSYYGSPREYLDQLLDLTQNEGIAHYLSLIQRAGGRLRTDQLESVNAAFREFNRTAEELRSPTISRRRADDLIRNSNTSAYWESYGAITGMIIAKQIDNKLGRQALMETIALGPQDFFGKYVMLMKTDTGIPPLGEVVAGRVSQ